MAMYSVFGIAASAMSAQAMRLNVVASNLANADSAVGPGGQPYKAKQVEFSATLLPGTGAEGVTVNRVLQDNTPPRKVYEPNNPLADKQGYVAYPNVNVVDEMADMIDASRSFQEDVDMMSTAKQLMQKTLTLGQ